MKRLTLFLLFCASCGFVAKKAEAPTLMATSAEVVADPFVSDDLSLTRTEEFRALIAPPKPLDKIVGGFAEEVTKEEKTAPFGYLIAELVPHPGRELSLPSGSKVTLVSLRDLSKAKSEEVMIERRTKLATRESLGDLRVLGACLKGACVDGLMDQKSQRVLLQDKPSQEELSLAKNGWVERLLRIATVGEAHTSIYLGRVAMQDNKVTQAILECATYHRLTGARGPPRSSP